jgi:hypothetical protein
VSGDDLVGLIIVVLIAAFLVCALLLPEQL